MIINILTLYKVNVEYSKSIADITINLLKKFDQKRSEIKESNVLDTCSTNFSFFLLNYIFEQNKKILLIPLQKCVQRALKKIDTYIQYTIVISKSTLSLVIFNVRFVIFDINFKYQSFRTDVNDIMI